MSGDRRGGIRRQKSHRYGDFLGLAHAAHGHGAGDVFNRLLGHAAFDHARLRQRRGNGIDDDIVRPEQAGKIFGQAHHAAFRDGIDAGAVKAAGMGGLAGEIDEAAPLRCLHRHRCVAAEKNWFSTLASMVRAQDMIKIENALFHATLQVLAVGLARMNVAGARNQHIDFFFRVALRHEMGVIEADH